MFKNDIIRSIFIGITVKGNAEIETAYLIRTFQVGIQHISSRKEDGGLNHLLLAKLPLVTVRE